MAAIEKIVVEVLVDASLESSWDAFTNPVSITRWNFASDDWHCPRAVNNLTKGGIFNFRMESKDGSTGFDLVGRYTEIGKYRTIKYELEDKRVVEVDFEVQNGKTRIREIFDPEDENTVELQRDGWQAILSNYKKYLETEFSAKRRDDGN